MLQIVAVMMCVDTVRIVTLLVLLVGTAQPEECGQDHHPTITFTSKQTLKPWRKKSYEKPFGGDVSIHCSADSNQNLSIINAGYCIETEKVNDTTIFLNVENPDVGFHKYVCKDNQTGCEDALTLRVIPSLSATSPSIRQTLDATHKRPLYYVPKGETYEVICSTNRLQSLEVSFIEGYRIKRLQLDVVNTTTAHSKIQADKPVERSYYCSTMEGGTEPITVLVDHYPNADNFRCIVYGFRRIECKWSSYSISNTFKLYYKQAKDIILFCTDNYRESNRGCTANMPVWRYNKFSKEPIDYLILETCNEVFCDNQTFPFDTDAITKVDPVSDLQLLNLSSNSAFVSWRNPSRVSFWDCDYKVEYRLLALKWHQVNTSSVQCDLKGCEFQLTLPCPDSHYEIRVSMKAKTAIGDKFWSNPTSVFFFTDPNASDVTDPMCSAEFKETEPLPSIEVVLFRVRELIRLDRKGKLALKKQIRVLKEKLARVRELTRLLESGNT